MTIELVRSALGWCTVISIALLLNWFLCFRFAYETVYRFHSRMFPMSRETFNAVHYAGLAIFKIFIFVFHLVPYLALSIVG